MSETTEPGPLGPQISLFDYAMHLHQQDPDSPLPRDGEPYPDEELHRRRSRPPAPKDRRLVGADVARILDGHFAKPDAPPSALADAFHDANVPIHHNEHITAAALRAEKQRVQHTGQWLVQHSTDRCSTTVGLALLAAGWAEEDIPLIRTIGLLSNRFGPLAARALQRRHGGDQALLWLAKRVTGWGRVYVIEALCLVGGAESRSWLLRHACDGDFLNGYFAGNVATAAHLHEAITAAEVDDHLVDHTGRLLEVMADCGGMGMTLEHYPPARIILQAHADHLSRQTPTVNRYVSAAVIADHLAQKPPERLGCTVEDRNQILQQYLATLDREDWSEMARAGLDPGSDFFTWFTANVAARLHLRAFPDAPCWPRPPPEPATDAGAAGTAAHGPGAHLILDCYANPTLAAPTADQQLPEGSARALPGLTSEEEYKQLQQAISLAAVGYIRAAERNLLRLYFTHALPEGRTYDLISDMYAAIGDTPTAEMSQSRKSILLGISGKEPARA
ncbi:hypothetical protein IMZ11_31260 [Microtetraspora sp. AC03309]|uniref:hypothetical protein n=1 Tax=Microtetraspora sp. AC03309 TaxID=2779376 RepID=UPI001E5A7D8C|nr:hypothetical protein [Microtetraspora sp. AC03309]MCC5580113.1 hypothetical protein [Microtetraspora sp. AC03309]